MGAIKTWSTKTLLKSAEKLVALSLRVPRGNLCSRYLFQRPMRGPKACLKQRFSDNARHSLMPAPKQKNRRVRTKS